MAYNLEIDDRVYVKELTYPIRHYKNGANMSMISQILYLYIYKRLEFRIILLNKLTSPF